MKSKRIISYIGLWALILPWLGFSWDTKTVLFSLTGLLLLYIGNKHYSEVKNINRKSHIDNSTKIASSPEVENNHIYTEPETIVDFSKKEEIINLQNPQSQHQYSEPNHFSTPVDEIQENKYETVPAEKFEIKTYSDTEEKAKTVKTKRKLEIVSRGPRKTTIKAISFDSLENNNE